MQQNERQHQKKSEEYLALLQRTQEDFMHYRHRSYQEQIEGPIAAQSALLAQLLPILDDLRLALESAPQELATYSLVNDLFQAEHQLIMLFDRLGIQQIGVPGEQFDPYRHQALTTITRADIPEGTIVQVIQPGYILSGRLIRPAQVIVAGPPSSTHDHDSPTQ
jgi:molecular chaperone GrpE